VDAKLTVQVDRLAKAGFDAKHMAEPVNLSHISLKH